MDLNLVVIAGRLSMEPDVTEYASGHVLIRLLVATKQTDPIRRVDVLPVSLWDPSESKRAAIEAAEIGSRVWVSGTMQRRFWSGEEGRKSRLEIIAKEVQVREQETADV